VEGRRGGREGGAKLEGGRGKEDKRKEEGGGVEVG